MPNLSKKYMEIKPISYLRNTQELTKLCDKGEAVYLTKNGHKALTLSLIHISRAHETPEHLVCRILLEKKK